ARRADVVHLQWLTVQPLDVHLPPIALGRRRRIGRPPLVLTAHDVLPREPRPGQLDAQRRLYERVDAVVVHSEHGAARLRDELGIDPARVHAIPHGAFMHFAETAPAAALPPELAATDKPVVLCFGLIRPYKGIDVLLEAWRGIADAELPAFFRRADLVVLPYREIDQSGVLFTALAFGKPLLLSAVGGFPEVAATGAADLVPPGDAAALHDALARLLADPAARARLAAAARAAAAGPYSWDAIAAQHLALYETLTAH